MKNFKFPAYILSAIIWIFLAWLIFVTTGKISGLAGQVNEISANIQILYILQAIVLIIPLFVIIVLIFGEYNHQKELRKQREEELKALELAKSKEAEEDPEELEKLKELQRQEEIDNRRKALGEAFEKAGSSLSNQNKKITSEKILSCISKAYEITQAEIFLRETTDEADKLVLSSTFAFYIPEEKVFEFEIGEGLIGQVAKAGQKLYLTELPEGYITVKSGLGLATPSNLAIIPWKNQEGKVFAIIELAAFKPFYNEDLEMIEKLEEKVVDFYG